jgi:hypothetical protein
MVGASSTNEEEKNAYRFLVKMAEGKRSLRGSRRGWVYNTKMVLTEIGCCGMGWIDHTQDRDQWRAFVNRH